MYNMKLGRLPSLIDKRTLILSKYLPKKIPTSPRTVRWDLACNGVFSLGKNDVLGTCVTVSAANQVNVAKSNESSDFIPVPDAEIVEQARVLGGLDGMTILEMLKFWRNNPMFGSRLKAFVQITSDKDDPDLLKFIINVFGGAIIGVWMPRAWQTHPTFWDTLNVSRNWFNYRPGSWGGHAVVVCGYEPSNKHGTIYKAISWAKTIDITQDAINQYVDEIWTNILPEWYAADQKTPSGFDYAGLQSDINLLK